MDQRSKYYKRKGNATTGEGPSVARGLRSLRGDEGHAVCAHVLPQLARFVERLVADVALQRVERISIVCCGFRHATRCRLPLGDGWGSDDLQRGAVDEARVEGRVRAGAAGEGVVERAVETRTRLQFGHINTTLLLVPRQVLHLVHDAEVALESRQHCEAATALGALQIAVA